ncbi:MAG: hypothetical protein KDJ35_04010 [Alphaproteobacteria bacterium]|nr:hypothetical protein [Alphaproteobacteria bacterium]
MPKKLRKPRGVPYDRKKIKPYKRGGKHPYSLQEGVSTTPNDTRVLKLKEQFHNKRILIDASCSKHLKRFFNNNYGAVRHVFDVVQPEKFDGDVYHYALKKGFNFVVTKNASKDASSDPCLIAEKVFENSKILKTYYGFDDKKPIGIVLLPGNINFREVLNLINGRYDEILEYMNKQPTQILDLR